MLNAASVETMIALGKDIKAIDKFKIRMRERLGGIVNEGDSRMTWQSPYVQMKEARRARRIEAKPVCPSCGWACDVCFRERICCLIVARKPE